MHQSRKRTRRTLLTFGAFFVGGAIVAMLGAPRRVRELPESQPALLDAVAVTSKPARPPEPVRRGFAARLAFASMVAAVFVGGGALTAFGGDRFARLVGGSGTTHVVVTTTSTPDTAQWRAPGR